MFSNRLIRFFAAALLGASSLSMAQTATPTYIYRPQTIQFNIPVKLTQNAIDTVAVVCEIRLSLGSSIGLAGTLIPTPGGQADTVATFTHDLSDQQVHSATDWLCVLVPITGATLASWKNSGRIQSSPAPLASRSGSFQKTMTPQ
jgi:hypothetical protein